MKKLMVMLGGLFIFQCGFSQENGRKYSLDSILIESKKKDPKENSNLLQNGQATSVLTPYDMARNNPNYIEQSLGTVPGVQVDKRTQYGGQRVVVRGYGNDQKFNNWGVKFYLNGTPITDAEGVTILEDIDFSLINSLSVIKGPVATRYGGGTGGVVQFYMLPNIKKGVSLAQNTMAGSFNTFNSNTRLDVVNQKYSLLFNYGHLQSDGYRPNGNTNKNNYTFLGNFSIGEKQQLMVYASHFNSFEGVSGQISTKDYYAGIDNGNAAYIRKNSHNHFITNRFILSHKWDILPNFKNNTSIFYHSLSAERVAAGAFVTSEQPNYGFRTTFNGDFNINKNFKNTIEVGAEHLISTPLVANYRFDGSDNNIPLKTKPIKEGSFFKYNNYATSFFLSNRIHYAPMNLTLITGVSANTTGYYRKDLLAFPGLLPEDKKDTSLNKKFPIVLSPQVALQKKWQNHLINLSYSEGYNAPIAKSAYIDALGITNDNLKPEYAKMWDLTTQGTFLGNSLNYEISVFNINVKNKLTILSAKDENNNIYNYWANTGAQQNKGIELSLAYAQKIPLLLTEIKPFANFSLYNFKYTNFSQHNKDYSGNYVVGVPSIKYTLGLDFKTKMGFYMQNTLNYLSDVYTDFSNATKIKGFALLNAKLGYTLNLNKWSIDTYVLGNNLTNQINYSYLFLGNAVGDSDPNNGYSEDVTTDINPGASKAYFMGGINLTYHF